MITQKLSDAEMTADNDTHAKRDVMSILVRARRTGEAAYALSDEALVDQVVRLLLPFVSSQS